MLKSKPSAPLFLLPAALIILFFPVLFCGKTLFLRDITYLFHPWRALCSEMVIKGQVPLWNQYAFCGMPLLANWQTAVFYPFSLLFYLLPFSLALKFYQILHLFIAGLFVWLFVRDRGLSRWAALTAAVLFPLNGYFLTRTEFLSHIGVDAWLFALLLFAANPVLLALALSCSFLAGHQMFFVSAALLLLFSMTDDRLSTPLTFKNLLMAFILVSGLCACQLLPTIELSRLSARVTGGIDAATAMINSLRFRDVPGLVTPLLFPSSTLPMAGEKFPWAGTFYIGISGTLATLPALLLLLKKRIPLFAFGLTIAGILLSLGDSTFIYPCLYNHFYFFRIFRYPSQFMLLAVAGMSLLAGYGVERLRWKYLAAITVLAELLLTGAHFQATADDAYFTEKPATAAFLQSAPAGRFILSPGTESDRHIRGRDLVDSWQKARDLLYGMSCLPYHLSNAFGVGEPLAPASNETMVDQAYRAPHAVAALQRFSDMGIQNLVCKDRLSKTDGYSLIYNVQPFIYRIESLPSMYSVTAGRTTLSGITTASGRVFFRSNAAEPSTVLWKENFYPGWQTYINGRKTVTAKGGTAFRETAIPAGGSTVFQLYRPMSFAIGACVSVGAVVIVAVYALSILCIRRRREEMA